MSKLSRSLSQMATSPVRLWLFAMAFLVFCMVIVGGATRLTDSGLSITEWQPLLGAIPPLSEADWQAAFAKYQTIPEYQLVNKGMDMAAFQFIYWWEWSHRFLGRFIGVAFLVPLVWFAVSGRISRAKLPRLAGLFILGGLQGALGWYMVKSGLTERVDVSQYRLAAHLTLASAIYAALLWTAFGWNNAVPRAWNWQSARAACLVALVLGQIALGGFVAGLDAGMAYNEWPLMDGAIIPAGLFAAEPLWRNFFENALTVQFQHRVMAYLVILAIGLHVWLSRPAAHMPSLVFLFIAVFLQAAIGVWTLLAQVPLHLGLVHQGGALVLLLAAVAHLHYTTISRKT